MKRPDGSRIWHRSNIPPIQKAKNEKSGNTRKEKDYSELEPESSVNNSEDTFGVVSSTFPKQKRYPSKNKSPQRGSSMEDHRRCPKSRDKSLNRKDKSDFVQEQDQMDTFGNHEQHEKRNVKIVEINFNDSNFSSNDFNEDRRQVFVDHSQKNPYKDVLPNENDSEFYVSTKAIKRFKPYDRYKSQSRNRPSFPSSSSETKSNIFENIRNIKNASAISTSNQQRKAIIFKTSEITQEEGHHIVRIIVHFLANGEKTLDAMIRELARNSGLRILIEDQRELLIFLEKYSDIFYVEAEKENNNQILVFCKTEIEFCRDFTAPNKSKACTGRCGGLHICKYHILGKCDADVDSCPYGHELFNSHNKLVLKTNFLDDLNFHEIRSLMRKPQSRRGIAVPMLCSHYNVQHGCRNESKCKFLHLCNYMFHEAGCKFSARCKRSHYLRDYHNQHILGVYGLDKIDDNEIIKMIKANHREYQNFKPKKENLKLRKDEFESGFVKHSGDIKASCSSKFHWSIFDDSANATFPLNSTESTELEQLYQQYLSARICQICINGERYEVDMENLSAKNDARGQFILKRMTKSVNGIDTW